MKKQKADKIVRKWRNIILEANKANVMLDNNQKWNMIADFFSVKSYKLSHIVLRKAIAWKSLSNLTEMQASELLREVTNWIYN